MQTANPLSMPQSSTQPKARWWRDPAFVTPLTIFLVARILTLIIAFMAVKFGPVTNPFASDPIFVESMKGVNPNSAIYPLIEPWQRWDSGWYLKMAKFGYAPDDGTIIFAPLYPTLTGAIGALTGDTLLGGIIVSNLSCLAYLIILYKLVQTETRRPSAPVSVLLTLVAFPSAFYFFAAYTESLFIALAAGTFLAAQYKRWWLTGVIAAAATLTRVQGAVLCLPVGWMAFVEAPRFWQAVGITWSQRIRQAIPRLFAIGLGPLMAALFLLYLAVSNLGDVTDAYGKYWALIFRPPWSSVFDAAKEILAGTASSNEIASFLALIFIVGLMLWALRSLPIRYSLYMWPTLFLVLLRYYPQTLLNGTVRYALDFFPIFIVLGIWFSSHRRIRLGYILIGLILETIFLFLFARWMWIA